jgi:hypothetical protein
MPTRPLLLSVAVLLLLGAPAHTTQEDPAKEALFREISDGLVCQCGCNKMLTICEMQGCHSATPMRAEIKEKLAEGESKEAILFRRSVWVDRPFGAADVGLSSFRVDHALRRLDLGRVDRQKSARVVETPDRSKRR